MAFNNKNILITGASRGIGKAIAIRLAAEGANIAIASKTVEQHPKLEGTIYSAAEEIDRAGSGKVIALQADIRPIDVEKTKPQAIDAPGRCLSHPVVEHQPSLYCFDRGRAKSHLIRVPPPTTARLEYYLVVAPML